MHRLHGHLDLILGRLLATKVRCYEYNWACAVMKKQPRKFQNLTRTRGSRPRPRNPLFSKGGGGRHGGEVLSERVVDEHPGTPWARMAQCELNSPFGFTWVETYIKPVERDPQVAGKAMSIDVNRIHFSEYRSCAGYWPVHFREKFEVDDIPMRVESLTGYVGVTDSNNRSHRLLSDELGCIEPIRRAMVAARKVAETPGQTEHAVTAPDLAFSSGSRGSRFLGYGRFVEQRLTAREQFHGKRSSARERGPIDLGHPRPLHDQVRRQ